MNFTTQAAEDILTKIDRDPAEIRHWRQLLILCFDQKSIETLQTLQVIVAGIEQIWNQKRQRAKDAYAPPAVTNHCPPQPSIPFRLTCDKRKPSANWRSLPSRHFIFIGWEFFWRKISTCPNKPRPYTNEPWP